MPDVFAHGMFGMAWLGRLLNSIFWLLGGLALFDLARRMASISNDASNAPVVGALSALAYYVALPFAVQASRAFQPDPGMVVWIILASWAAYRWSETGAWRWALAAGAAAGSVDGPAGDRRSLIRSARSPRIR